MGNRGLKDGQLKSLWVGGGEYMQGKIKRKKNHARQLTLKNIHAMALKKFIQGI